MAAVEKKSLLVSGLVSFLFGPLGWAYSAPWKSAMIGGGLWLLAASILPKFLLIYLATVVCPASAIAGLLYTIGYNSAGERIPLFGREEPKKLGR
ncbi:MAG: hypothetical protein AAGA54_30635 [Myxococcota bacterium]